MEIRKVRLESVIEGRVVNYTKQKNTIGKETPRRWAKNVSENLRYGYFNFVSILIIIRE